MRIRRRRRGRSNGRPRIDRSETIGVGRAAALLFGVALVFLVVPVGVQAAAPLFNAIITDPVDQTRRARVDASGSLQVSATGSLTGSVEVTNTPLPVSGEVDVGNFPDTQEVSGTVHLDGLGPASNFHWSERFQVFAGTHQIDTLDDVIDASLIVVNGADDAVDIRLFPTTQGAIGSPSLILYGADRATGGGSSFVIPLAEPIQVGTVEGECFNDSDSCQFTVSIVGR